MRLLFEFVNISVSLSVRSTCLPILPSVCAVVLSLARQYALTGCQPYCHCVVCMLVHVAKRMNVVLLWRCIDHQLMQTNEILHIELIG